MIDSIYVPGGNTNDHSAGPRSCDTAHNRRRRGFIGSLPERGARPDNWDAAPIASVEKDTLFEKFTALHGDCNLPRSVIYYVGKCFRNVVVGQTLDVLVHDADCFGTIHHQPQQLERQQARMPRPNFNALQG